MSTSTMAAWYSVAPGPWGPIHLAVRGGSVVAIELMTPTRAFVASLERRVGGPVVPAASSADSVAGLPPRAVAELLERGRIELDEYLAGERRSFDLPTELARVSAWDRLVLEGVRAVPYGSVTSYGRLARAIGRPGAARAVGGAVGRNPIGIIIPCHRVIAGDGGLGGYGGDWYGSREELLAIKRGLLELEGTRIPTRAFLV